MIWREIGRVVLAAIAGALLCAAWIALLDRILSGKERGGRAGTGREAA
jgi:hypothetical protein